MKVFKLTAQSKNEIKRIPKVNLLVNTHVQFGCAPCSADRSKSNPNDPHRTHYINIKQLILTPLKLISKYKPQLPYLAHQHSQLYKSSKHNRTTKSDQITMINFDLHRFLIGLDFGIYFDWCQLD